MNNNPHLINEKITLICNWQKIVLKTFRSLNVFMYFIIYKLFKIALILVVLLSGKTFNSRNGFLGEKMQVLLIKRQSVSFWWSKLFLMNEHPSEPRLEQESLELCRVDLLPDVLTASQPAFLLEVTALGLTQERKGF